MRFRKVFVAVGVVLALTATVSAADKTAKVKKKSALQGQVLEVQKDQDKDTGTLVVKVQPPKKKAEAAPAATPSTEMDKKFHITAETKIEKVLRVAKGEFKRETASLKDVQKGDSVSIVAAGKDQTDAKTVEIAAKKKKKAKGAK